jgi:hypothetical protein
MKSWPLLTPQQKNSDFGVRIAVFTYLTPAARPLGAHPQLMPRPPGGLRYLD